MMPGFFKRPQYLAEQDDVKPAAEDQRLATDLSNVARFNRTSSSSGLEDLTPSFS
jgi:hypothetical protein